MYGIYVKLSKNLEQLSAEDALLYCKIKSNISSIKRSLRSDFTKERNHNTVCVCVSAAALKRSSPVTARGRHTLLLLPPLVIYHHVTQRRQANMAEGGRRRELSGFFHLNKF